MGAILQAGRVGWAVGLAACTYPLPSDEAAESGAPPGSGLRTYDVRGGGVQDGNQAVLRGVVVTTAPQAGLDRFHVQDPAGGPDSGLEVWMAEGADLPSLSVGDQVDLQGNVHLVAGRYGFWLSRPGDAAVVGQGQAPVEADLGRPASWEPWVGAAVRLEERALVGCPDALGAVPAAPGPPLGGPAWPASLGLGDAVAAVEGVVVATGGGHALWVREGDALEATSSGEGCVLAVAAAREAGVTGAVELPEVVVVVGPTDDGAAWVQDPGGGPGTGLPVTGLAGVSPGDAVALQGRLAQAGDRLSLAVDAVTAAGSMPVPAAPFDPATDDPAPWAGARVEVAGLTVIGSGPAGSLETAEGLRLDGRLRALPWALGAATGPLAGALDQWPDETWVLVVAAER